MNVLALQIDLRFPESRSLKQKRGLLKPLVEGLRNRFRVSVAEVAHQNTWQRTQLGVAVVGERVGDLETFADGIERFVWSMPDLEVLAIERFWLDIDQ